MKSFTDLEQSKKLAEILPLESADYHYITQGENSYIYPYSLSSDNIKQYNGNIKYIPCWSLAALLDVIPSGKALIHDKGNLGYKCICNNMDTYFHDNPVDACCELILKLKELNLL